MTLFICSWRVLFGLPRNRYWFQSISFLWRNGRSFKTSRIGSKPRGPEHVCCLGLQQNSTHSTVSQSTSHTSLDRSVWGMNLHQQSLLICKHSVSEYYIFSFKSVSLKLSFFWHRSVCSERSSTEADNQQVSVLFSWPVFSKHSS